MTVTLEQCCAAKVHLTICDDDGYCEFCGNQDCGTSTPNLTPVSYDRALRIVCDFTEGLSSESSEYERGQLEMLADMFPAANVETERRMAQIAQEIRAMYAADTAAMRTITVELTEEQLRAALDVIGKRVSVTNEHGTPLFMAERELDSALMAHERTEGGS